MTSRWVEHSDSGHLLLAQPVLRQTSARRRPVWSRLKQAALGITPGELLMLLSSQNQVGCAEHFA